MATAEELARRVAGIAGLPAPPGQTKQPGQGLAPWPQVDKYPTIRGQGLSLSTLAGAARMALVGYRTQYVDLLTELRQKDAHAISVLQKRVLSVASGRLEISPCDEEDGGAVEAAKLVNRQVAQIPDLTKSLAHLQWSIYFGLNALENHWARDGAEWVLEKFSTIHSRRLNFPDQSSWDPYVWDQGIVSGPFLAWPTQGVYGLRIADYPGKFVFHTASLLGEYPTREGIGHVIATWSILKLIGARGGAKYLERFAEPWPDVSYTTSDDGKPRAADQKDIDQANAVFGAAGQGAYSFWVHPDTVKMDLKSGDASGGKGNKITFLEWLRYCDGEHSKATLGGTLTTEVGSAGGSRALGDTQKKGELTLEQYDATCLAETFKRDVVYWILRLNRPDLLDRMPLVALHVEDEPDPSALMDRFAAAADRGMQVDHDEAARLTAVPIIAQGEKGRRLFPAKAIDPREIDPDLAQGAAEISDAHPKPEPPKAFGAVQPEEDEAPPGGEKPGKKKFDDADGEADDE